MTSRSILDLRIRTDDAGGMPETIAFVAPAAALEPLATAIGVDQVLSCEANLRLTPAGEVVQVTGVARARVAQTCSVSLDRFETDISEPIDIRFAPDSAVLAASRRAQMDGEEGSAGMADVPEPIVNGTLDLGALVQEFLALGVDPFPRKPGVTFEPPTSASDEPSPFAALAKLRGGKTEPEV